MKRFALLAPLFVVLLLVGSMSGVLPRVSAADPGRCEITDLRCLNLEVGQLASDLGPREALARMRLLAEQDIEFDYRCHTLVHRVGLVALTDEGGAAKALLAAGDELRSCSDGYIHGVMLGALTDTPLEQLAENAQVICNDPEVRAAIGGVLANCLHGAGHGILTASGGDLELAYARCKEAFGSSSFAEESGSTRCANGAFMEALIPTVGDDTVADPIGICAALETSAVLSDVLWLCYSNAADAASQASVSRPDPAMIDRCLAVPITRVESCISGALSHPSASAAAQTLADFCAVLGDAGIPGSPAADCLRTTIEDLSIHRPEDPRPVELCQIAAGLSHLSTPKDRQLVDCVRDYLAELAQYWGDQSLPEKICALLSDPALVRACLAPKDSPLPVN
jgi:hypothetical protein